MSERIKTLVVKKAIFSADVQTSLQDILVALFQKEPVVKGRITQIDLLKSMVFAKIDETAGDQGVLVRVFEYENGTTGSINFASTTTSAGIEEVAPPDDQQFLGSDLVLLVKNNTIIACGMSNKNRTFARALLDLCNRQSLLTDTTRLEVCDVPNSIGLTELKQSGVKHIEFGVTGYLNSMPDMDSKINRVVRSVFSEPSSVADVRKRANAVGRMSLSRGRFKLDEIQKDDWLTMVGEAIVESDNDESYKIELENGKTLTNKNLKLQKKVKVRRYANTVRYEELEAEMVAYQRELVGDGFVL